MPHVGFEPTATRLKVKDARILWVLPAKLMEQKNTAHLEKVPHPI